VRFVSVSEVDIHLASLVVGKGVDKLIGFVSREWLMRVSGVDELSLYRLSFDHISTVVFERVGGEHISILVDSQE
jgi:hypothetical protein